MLDGTLVNGRPAWKHTDGRCWIAFEGGIWRGQPEASLGQKSGFLKLSDEAAASPDASSATWQAWTGSAWAAQPALKCTVVTAAELSAAQAAAARRAEEEQRARASADRESQRFKLNERVECRDRGESWQPGTVVSVAPLQVKPDGAAWTAGYAWDEVRILSPEAAAELSAAQAAAARRARARAEERRRALSFGQALSRRRDGRRALSKKRAEIMKELMFLVKRFRGPCAACCKPLRPGAVPLRLGGRRGASALGVLV